MLAPKAIASSSRQSRTYRYLIIASSLLITFLVARSIDGYTPNSSLKRHSLPVFSSTTSTRHTRQSRALLYSQVSSMRDDALQSAEKTRLIRMLSSVPSNAPTPRKLTDEILQAVTQLEQQCPTPDDEVLAELAGNWELLWTAQDPNSAESKRGAFSWINPLENQSYSNNPSGREISSSGAGGRANPILPREIQDALENLGILEPSGRKDATGDDSKEAGGGKSTPVRSSQAIDMNRSRVRNVVSVELRRPLPVKGSLIVDVGFKPNRSDERRIDVKFDSCRLQLQNSPIDITFPLGIVGPTGWLRTGYIDDTMRITRGHKGSVFILSRTAKRRG